MKSRKRQTGFTLVELMVALVLSLFLIGGALTIYLSGQRSVADSNALARIQENTRFANDYLLRDIRNAGFNDVVTLTNAEISQINARYAVIAGSGDELRLRYASRGHCTQQFQTFKVVENRYFVENSQLMCQGYEVAADGTLTAGSKLALVSGIESVAFQAICEDGAACTTTCARGPNACVAVRVGMDFSGLQDINSSSRTDYAVEMTAAIRNIVMAILYDNATAT